MTAFFAILGIHVIHVQILIFDGRIRRAANFINLSAVSN